MPGIEDLIKFAETTIGWSDENNTKRTPAHTWYNEKFGNPDPSKYAWDWCDGWVTYCAWKTGNEKAVVFGTGYAYTVAHAEAFRTKGQWKAGTAGIRRGDIVFFDWAGADNISAIDHVGIVTGVTADGKVETIEANTENAVRRRVRTSFEIAGYGRPAYGSTTAPPPSGPTTVKLSDARAKQPAATRVIQDALNRFAPPVAVDGDYGPQTEAAYTRWQKSLGWPGDGLPGAHSLSELGKRYGFAVDLEGAASVPPSTTPTPPSTPQEPTVPTPYTPPPFPTGLRPGSSNPSARGLQKALKDAGYMSKTIPYADNYGPNTEAAVDRFHDANPSLSDGDGWDPIIGPKGWDELHREAYSGAKVPTPTPAPVVTTPTLAEPPHDYRRVYYGGKLVNKRTEIMLRAARGLMNASTPFSLTQGSYNRGVSASAGTHDGGGVVDINTNGMNVNAALLALRRAGFAAWYRTSAEGFSPHIHACAIGDREMAPGARNQVVAYFNGRNGLANGRADTAPASVGRPYPSWAAKYR